MEQNPVAIIIVEDSSLPMPEFLNPYRHLNITWLCNGRRMGQPFSIDRAYAEVKTEYVFHTEDDWQFSSGGFLRESFAILEKYPEISMVELRSDWPHPLVNDPKYPFQIAMPYWRGVYGGTCWNPGLRRLSDFKRFGGYSKHVGFQNGLEHEVKWSKMHLDLGYRIAALPGHCFHIGGGRNTTQEQVEFKLPKVLIAIPACHQFNYGAWESEQSPRYSQAKAYHGSPYGSDIHISGENPRIQAVRDTWWNDIKAFPNVEGKFFYGEGASRTPEADEVFLPISDDYEHLPNKTIAVVRYALANGYDFLFKADDDSYVWVDRLVIELMGNNFQYAGYLNGNVCSGGTGYWLSRYAMEKIQDNPDCWAEDVWVAKCMKYGGIEPVMLPNHCPGFSNHWFDLTKIPEGAVCIHAVKPEGLREIYARERSSTSNGSPPSG